ncbi:eRF1 methyltransferase catalytic subunit MTQ2 [Golovinomyces cichoracearum]|uniref:ERF1 methyltransferase catalytic subunit MTQ2 n=1 Tax=Golovinomyces cichoracearum TaxID=62708 RepID=A0A420ILK4_9PEZI|nr:eRF1 methyltransferase catalytic subunit MTQ2 [Golovinomyces cichoracearum]
MLPTPSTSHVPYEKVYEPAEDSFLLLDTLSSDKEKAFLKNRFRHHQKDNGTANCRSPLIIEVGSGSGVVISFIHAHCETILGRSDVLTAGIDININACRVTEMTVRIAEEEKRQLMPATYGFYIGSILGDLTGFLKPNQVDVLIFNPPYVPTSKLPKIPTLDDVDSSNDGDSHLLSLSYSGGIDGMETTNRLLKSLPDILSSRYGCAYVLLCAQNKPEAVKESVRKMGSEWQVETVGTSGNKAGWEKLQIIRIWRD